MIDSSGGLTTMGWSAASSATTSSSLVGSMMAPGRGSKSESSVPIVSTAAFEESDFLHYC